MENELTTECLGCSIVKKEIIPPGGILYETKDFLIHQDPLVPIEGFLIITVKKHISSITELTDEQRHTLIDLLNEGVNLIKRLNIAEEITIIQEERSNHLHFWLFPWQTWMKEKSNYNVREICEYTKLHTSKIKCRSVMDTIEKFRNLIQTDSDFFQKFRNTI
jgi:diadenosine tetraphosphate (Ap4A) HIT family hydrolase